MAALPRWEPETVICIAWEPEAVNRKGGWEPSGDKTQLRTLKTAQIQFLS
jgi:hypothetical protein